MFPSIEMSLCNKTSKSVAGAHWRQRFLVSLALWSNFAFLFPGQGAQVTVSWIGSSSGNYNTAGSWSGGIVPNNGANTYIVLVDNGNTGQATVVSVNTSPTIDNLVIDASDTVRVLNGQSFTVAGGGITNAGLFEVASTSSTTSLRVGGGTVSLTGGGILNLGANGNSRILGTAGTDRMINVNNTISGAGQIGANFMAFSNLGVVEANQINSLTIDPTDSQIVTNSGTMRASTGGALILNGGTYNNTGGLIRADATSASVTVNVQSATITGGTVDTTGPNLSQINLTGATITGGTLTLNSAGSLRALTGTSTLEGTVTVPPGGQIIVANGAALVLSSSGSYENAGNVALNSTGSATDLRINGTSVTLTGGGTLTMANSANNRILGLAGTEHFVNANNIIFGAGQIGVNFLLITNQGTIIANQANSLTIDPTGNSTSAIPGVVNTGTLRADGGGTLVLADGNYLNTGGLIRANAGTANVSSSTINGGAVDIVGAGEVLLSSSTISDSTVANSSLGTIRAASGTNTLGGTLANPSGGQIVVNNAAKLTVDPSAANFINAGTVRVSNGGTLAMAVGDTYTESAGHTIVDGTLEANNLVDIQSGTLSGSGTVQGNVQNAGLVTPGSSAGKLTITANYTQASGGHLGIELGGLTPATQFDVLTISNLATLNGKLDVSLINGFVPGPGDTFQVLNFGSRSGDFAAYNGLELACGLKLQPVFTANSLLLVATNSPPSLSIVMATNAVVVSWSAQCADYMLQGNTNLTTTNWVTVPLTGPSQAVLTPAGQARFFRLFKP